MSSLNIWLWRPVGLANRRSRGLDERKTPLLKDAGKISHTPRSSTEAVMWMTPKSEPLNLGKILESLLERQMTSKIPLWDTAAGSSHFLELFLLQKHWCLKEAFWSLPSSLIVPRVCLPSNKTVPVPVPLAEHLGMRSQPCPLVGQH